MDKKSKRVEALNLTTEALSSNKCTSLIFDKVDEGACLDYFIKLLLLLENNTGRW